MPHMDAYFFSTLPRSTMAPGRVAIFYYPSTDQWHVAYVISLGDDGFYVAEGNYHHCASDRRFIPYGDPALVGFWDSGFDSS